MTIKAKDSAANNNNQNNRNQNNGSQNNSSVDGNADAGTSKVQTGDENHILFYGAMFIASVSGLTTLKRREEKRKF